VHDPRLALHNAKRERERASNQPEQRSEAIFGTSFAANLELAELKGRGQPRLEELIQVGGNPAYSSSRRTEEQNMWT
jgi:hypothetical protein